ncbi:MAG: NAD(P)H-hydrate epimerase, partial [Rhodanobacter sp.]
MDLAAALLTVDQMAEADRLSMAAGVPEFELMANAGACVANAIMARWPVQPLLVLCGLGNNGGDGFVAALRLADAGWPVRVAMLGRRSDLKGSAHRHAERWQGDVEPLAIAVLKGAQLIVDALFGAGLSRPLTGIARDTLAAAAAGKAPIIAIDMPSGVMGDTGEALGAVPVALTVTFFRKKPGHVLLPARDLCGEVVVADIGSPLSVLHELDPDTFENAP